MTKQIEISKKNKFRFFKKLPMKGLCHTCYTSNVDIVLKDGLMICKNCLETRQMQK